MVASTLAHELNITRLILDQLLCWTGNPPASEHMGSSDPPGKLNSRGDDLAQLPFQGRIAEHSSTSRRGSSPIGGVAPSVTDTY